MSERDHFASRVAAAAAARGLRLPPDLFDGRTADPDPAANPAQEYESFQARQSGRKHAGVYYTPPSFVRVLLDSALADLPHTATVLDPACGVGHLLVPAAERLAARRSAVTGAPLRRCLRELIDTQVFGVEADPLAAEICRATLWLTAAEPGVEWQPPSAHIATGDGLFDPLPGPGRFDVVVGNPPFVNAVEGGLSANLKARLRRSHPHVGGTADLAYHFLARAASLAPRVGFVLPRPVLGAPSATGLRASLRPRLIWAPGRSRFFADALVFACVVVIGPGGCRVGTDPQGETWVEVGDAGADWWSAVRGNGPAVETGPTVGSVFEVWAGTTVAEAYALRPFVRDDPAATRYRLLTTGLIDPGECLWGRRRCRYLGADHAYPVVTPSSEWSVGLRKRAERSRRPKVVVAGLSKRVEAYLDAAGAYFGAVSTFAMLHPTDDVPALAGLTGWLHGPEVGRLLAACLGANAVGGGDTVMTRAFLRGLPFPG